MLADIVRSHLSHALVETEFPDFGKKYRGKVRDTYSKDTMLILVTTDRISAFDHILHKPIPFKGQVLNQLAAYFFERTADIVPNHVLAVPDPNVTVAILCDPLPVEFVVRGYLAGHAWREYKAGKRMLCGKELPDGLQQNSRLPEPILTPATKAASGHDQDVSREEVIASGIMDADTFERLEQMALHLFQRGTEMALKQGLILVDTKYEFGLTQDKELVVIDEVHTPDSSRYFYADTYDSLLQQDQPQRQLSKEFVREWLMDHGFQGKSGQTQPELPDDFRVEIAFRYIELYEQITGQKFVPDTNADPASRIKNSLEAYFLSQRQ